MKKHNYMKAKNIFEKKTFAYQKKIFLLKITKRFF